MSLPKFYAQYKSAPTITGTSATSDSITCTIKNNATVSAMVLLYKATSSSGSYSTANAPITVAGGSSGSITAHGLSASTTYYWKATLVDPNGRIKESPYSSVVTKATSAAGLTVTIPARQKGISALQYKYTNPSGSTAYANAGTSQTSIQVKSGTTIQVYAHTLSDTTNYQVWSGNTTSWTINANTTLPTYHAQYKTFPNSYGCTANSGTSITMAYEPKLTAGLRLYKNGSVVTSVSDKTSVTSLTASGLTNGTEYTFTATHYDSTGQVKEGPKSSGIIVKAWSNTTTYNVTFPALDKAYGVGQQTWTYYNNMGVKSTRVAALSDSGYSGDTKAATIAVRSGLTVAITDTKYYSDIANYIEPSQYMGSSGKNTNWTITSATTVNQMFTQ